MRFTIVSAMLLAGLAAQSASAQRARQLWLQDGHEPKTQPSSASAGSPAFSLTVTGTGFSNGSTVLWNNQALSTTFNSATQVTARVPAAMIASPGTASITVSGSGVTSAPAAFAIVPATAQAKVQPVKKHPNPSPAAPVEAAQSRPQFQKPSPNPDIVTAMPVSTPGKVPASPLGLRYSLVRLGNGSPQEVSPDSTFHSGDWVKVKVEANLDGYLYVVSRGSSGNWNVLFPSASEGGDNRLKARREYSIPPGDYGINFNDQAGEERLFIVYSAEPVEDLDALIYSLRKPERTEAEGARMMAKNSVVNDGLVSRLRDLHSRDLIIDRLPSAEKEGSRVEKVYVVNASGGRLVADIALKHE